ncbi:MAG: hypothetical protein WBD56_02075 [Anaerolineales bacterium]
MNTFRRFCQRILPLSLSIFLIGCSQILPKFIPSPTATPSLIPTATQTATLTTIPTATYTVTPSPSPTVTVPPTSTSLPTLSGTFTVTVAPTQSIGYIQPRASAKFKGNFDGGVIVFNINPEGDRVTNLRVGYLCFGKQFELNLSRASLKITNSTFAIGSDEIYVQGQFTSPTTAKGVFNTALTKGDKTCKYKYVGWSAAAK